MITELLDKIDSVMYYPVLIVVMAVAGLFIRAKLKGHKHTLSLSYCRFI